MVEIKILGNTADPKHQDEHEAALQLKEVLAGTFAPTDSGTVVILVNLKVYGGRCKDIDLLLFGSFEPPVRRTRIPCRTNGQPDDDTLRYRDLEVTSFCAILEAKSHSASGIRFTGSQSEVLYKDGWHDATSQSDQQNIALRIFFEDTLRWQPSPYIANLIWFTSLERESLKEHKNHNYLPASFSFDELLTLICRQARPWQRTPGHGLATVKCTKADGTQVEGHLKKAISFFSEAKKAVGTLTRSKLEALTKKRVLKDQAYAKSLGHRLVMVKGRAGTGKTMKLLHMAYDLADRDSKKCLLLTYNLALVSDMRRLIALADLDRDSSGPSVKVNNIHSLMLTLMDGFGLETPAYTGKSFGERYEARRTLLHQHLQQGAITDKDFSDLAFASATKELSWDHIFVDEGQDWPEEEKAILFALFKPHKFVVADGIDQLVRSQRHIDWTEGVEVHLPIIGEKMSLRQTVNLIKFQADLATELGGFWDLEANLEARGGRVIVVGGELKAPLYKEMMDHTLAHGNKAYEMLFLVPPALVVDENDRRKFKYRDKWQKDFQMEIWDGTDRANRTDYPTHPDQHRLFQYDSSRGLEGWVVFCIWLDEFYEYKKRTYKNSPQTEQLALRTPKEQERIFATQWVMVPLTRAVDTLVITLRDTNSELAHALRRVAANRPGIVQWLA